MIPAAVTSRSLSHLACAGQTAGLWHAAAVVVRPVFANLRKIERARRDGIAMG